MGTLVEQGMAAEVGIPALEGRPSVQGSPAVEGTGLQGRAEGSLLLFQQRSIGRRKRRREEVNEELQ